MRQIGSSAAQGSKAVAKRPAASYEFHHPAVLRNVPPPTVVFPRPLRWWSLDRPSRVATVMRLRDQLQEAIVRLGNQGAAPTFMLNIGLVAALPRTEVFSLTMVGLVALAFIVAAWRSFREDRLRARQHTFPHVRLPDEGRQREIDGLLGSGHSPL